MFHSPLTSTFPRGKVRRYASPSHKNSRTPRLPLTRKHPNDRTGQNPTPLPTLGWTSVVSSEVGARLLLLTPMPNLSEEGLSLEVKKSRTLVENTQITRAIKGNTESRTEIVGCGWRRFTRQRSSSLTSSQTSS